MIDGTKTNIHICDDVFGIIAGIAATSVEGVKSMSGGITKNKLPFIDSENLKGGVLVEGNKKGLSVCMSLVIKDNYNLHDVCTKVQEKVKESLEDMVDVKVKDVKIRVDNIVEGKNDKK